MLPAKTVLEFYQKNHKELEAYLCNKLKRNNITCRFHLNDLVQDFYTHLEDKSVLKVFKFGDENEDKIFYWWIKRVVDNFFYVHIHADKRRRIVSHTELDENGKEITVNNNRHYVVSHSEDGDEVCIFDSLLLDNSLGHQDDILSSGDLKKFNEFVMNSNKLQEKSKELCLRYIDMSSKGYIQKEIAHQTGVSSAYINKLKTKLMELWVAFDYKGEFYL